MSPPQKLDSKFDLVLFLDSWAINEWWGADFLSDWVVSPGQEKVHINNIMDECPCKSFWAQAFSSISVKTLIEFFNLVIQWRGKSVYIRCDNGPEFISSRLEEWTTEHGIE
ncbi:transposase family protein [Phaeodactylibacter sp.]|uniref:integrase catalytic domain-containing protein n=1 Tax=Phaeodactylibacter sp. TaxID=1940289 RepID=UPI0032EB50B0